jgi:plastocyanin
MRRRLTAAIVAAAVLAVWPAVASATQYSAFAGGDRAKGLPKQASPNAFYPHTVTVHAGDTVRWDFRGFHTITFPLRGRSAPPLVVADKTKPVGGVNDAAGNAFWFNGQPNVLVNPVGAAPSRSKRYNGSTVVGSGVPLGRKPKPFALRFRRTGTFVYYCVVHPGMKARVRVVSKRTPVTSPAAQLRRAQLQLATDVLAARKTNARPSPSGATVDVGRTTPSIALYKMNPETRTISAGQAVTFTMAGQYRSEVHTVTFGPEKVRASVEKNFLGPVPGVSPPTLGLLPIGVYPSDQPSSAAPTYDGANHGNGFWNSGLLDNDRASPFPQSVTITFTKAGTYDYECVIHEHMDGRIVVR